MAKSAKSAAVVSIEKETEVTTQSPFSGEKLEQRKEAILKLQETWTKLNDALQNDKYPVAGGLNALHNLYSFMKDKAEWTFNESIGVIKLASELQDQRKEVKETGDFKLSALSLEAAYYFLSKHKSRGVESAKTFYWGLLKPILDAMVAPKEVRDRLNQIDKDIASLEVAIEMGAVSEAEDSIVNEIIAETLKPVVTQNLLWDEVIK
jgi:transcriptional accessory protein Tex/SPT6